LNLFNTKKKEKKRAQKGRPLQENKNTRKEPKKEGHCKQERRSLVSKSTIKKQKLEEANVSLR